MPLSPDLADLARAYDVVTDYVDWKGRQVYVPTATVEAVLSAMGVDLGDPASALRRRREDAWRRALPPCVVATRGTARWVPVHVTHGDAVHVVAELEDGTVRELAQVDNWVEPREVDGRLVGEATFEVPGDLPLGYHRLRAGSGRRSSSTPLIMTPAFLGLPESLRDRKGWGFAAQLYSVRSRQSWGVGDLADLAHLAVWSGKELGADFVLVNPLHAAEPSAPLEPSPYLPTSRRFFNPLYLRVEEVPEYTALSAPARAEVDRLAAEVHAALDGGDVVDRDTAWTAKRAALEILHAVPRSDEREARSAGTARRRARRSTTSPPGGCSRTSMVPTSVPGRPTSVTPPPVRWRRCARGASRRSTSRSGCSGCSTSSSPPHRRAPARPGWRWAPCTTSPSACTPVAPTRGGCGRRTPRG